MSGVDTWKKLSRLPNPDLEYVVKVNPGIFMDTGSGWVSEGSNTYSHTCEEQKVNAVLDDGVELTEKTSVGDVKANAGSWYFDFYNQIIYVHATDNDDLSNSSTDVVIIVKCWKFFATSVLEIDGIPCMPIVRQDSFPLLKLSVDDIIEGFYKFNFGSFSMENNGWWDTAIVDYIWYNARVVIEVGSLSLPSSEYQAFFVGRWSDAYVSDEEVVPSVKDIRVGTFATLPIDHYWTSNYPRLDPNAEGRPIPLFYGKKENIVPTCIQMPWEYTSAVSGVNNEGDTTIEVQEEIDAAVPSSGIVGIKGKPFHRYYYTSWSNSSGHGIFQLCVDAGCELIGNYSDSDIVYIVGGDTKWKWASRKVHSVSAVRLNGTVLSSGTDYTLDLANAELTLHKEIDVNGGDELLIDGEGFEAGDGSLLIHGSEIALDILKNVLGFLDDDLDLDSFSATESLRTYELAIYLDTEVGSREVLQTIGRSIVAFFAPTENGKLSFEAYEPTVPEGTLELKDGDYGKKFDVKQDESYVRDKVRILYDQDPKTLEFKEVEKVNYSVLYKYKVRDTLPFETYLKNSADAESVAGGILSMCSKPLTIIESSCGVKGFGLFPTRKLKLNRERAGVAGGSLDGDVFRIREVVKDTKNEKTNFVVMDDLQTLGEVFCYVCYSCQVCNVEEQSCDVCYECETCVSAQGGCAVCDSCQLCNTDQGGCQLCNSCQTCNTCQTTVGTCSTCQLCNTCQACNACEVNVSSCGTCQNCYGCQACNTCDVCDSCESQVSCQKCDTCQVCNTAQDCAVCDVCDSCESQVSCQKCDTCQVCDSCESQVSCAKCDTCQVCNTAQDCEVCDVCDACQICNTTQDCALCDVCDACENCYECQNCNLCQLCVTSVF